jgi:hypothetical protein
MATVMQSKTGRRSMHERLRVLCEQGYIGRRYDRSYKLQAQFAVYYLLPKGIQILKQWPERYQTRMLRNIRKDVNASARFVKHCQNVFRTYVALQPLYGETFQYHAKSELSQGAYDYFPKPLPDGYATYTTKDTHHGHFMIECFDDTKPQTVMRHRIRQRIDHGYTDDWKDNQTYPEILIVCDTEELEQKARRWVKQTIADEGAEDMKFYVTSLPKLTQRAQRIG